MSVTVNTPLQLKTLAVGLLLALNSYASEPDYAEMSLKQLTELELFSAASLIPTQINKAPGTVYSFNRDDFQRFGVRKLTDLLAFVPGMQINQYRKRHQSLWGRGLLERYNDKMILMVDGVRYQHLYYGHFSAGEALPLDNVERVEVILGPASSLYGANAFGGLIAVITRDYSEKPTVSMSLELADNQRQRVSGVLQQKNLQLFAQYLEQEAPFDDSRRSFIGGPVEQSLEERYENLSMKYRPTVGLELKADYRHSETPFLFIPNTQDAIIEESFLSLSAEYQQGELETGKFISKLYYQRDNTREVERESTSQRLAYQEKQNAIMAGASLTVFKQWQQHTLAVGAHWEQEEATNTRYQRLYRYDTGFLVVPEYGDLLTDPNIKQDNYAAFVQDVWQLNAKTELTLGSRYDNFDQFDSYFNHRLAVVHSYDAQQTFKAQLATAIRTPTFREYLKVLENTNFTPSAVEPEEITSLEFAYHYQWQQANLSLTAFNNQIDHYISEQPTPDLTGGDEYFSNSDDQLRLRGVEALYQWQTTNHWQFRVAAAYQQSNLCGDELPYLYDWSGSFQLNYAFNDEHSVGVTILYNNQRDDTNNFEHDNADGYWLSHLFIKGNLSDEWQYMAGVDNVFNETIYDPAADFGSQYNTERSQRELWLRLEWKPRQ